MKLRLILALCALLVSLLACSSPPTPSAAAVAVYDGGEITLVDVEDVLLAMPAEQRLAKEREIVDTYGEIARQIALTRLLIPEVAAAGGDPLADWKREHPELYRQLVVRLYVWQELLTKTPEVTDEEILAYYHEYPERFHRPPRSLLYHVFRRDRDGEDAATTLEEVRRRALAGEPFKELARRYSDSETRGLGGLLGWMQPGTLPPVLDELAFSLKAGEVSEPLVGGGGAVLFYAADASVERTFTVDEARPEIRRRLATRKLDEALEAAVAGFEPPQGSLVLDAESLAEILAADDIDGTDDTEDIDDDVVVLRVLDVEMTRGQLLEAAGGRDVPDERLVTVYTNLARRHRIYGEAVTTGYVERSEVRSRIAAMMRKTLGKTKLGERLEEEVRRVYADQDAVLRAFYDENPALYMTPLQLRLRALKIDTSADPERRMRQLEQLHAGLVAGERTLDDAAREAGGSVEEIGWRDFAELRAFDPKEQHYLLELTEPGYTVPYRLGESLRVLQVAERREPALQPYEEVGEKVRDDYVREHRNTLFDETATRLLDAARFRFLEENVRQALEVPALDLEPLADDAEE